MTNAGADVRTCAQSTDALATIKTWKADCIVSDIGMPNEDGYELIKKLRALRKKNGGRIPAIALTGFAGIDDKSKAIAAGYQAHIPKPADLGYLASEIVRLVQKKNWTSMRNKARPYKLLAQCDYRSALTSTAKFHPRS